MITRSKRKTTSSRNIDEMDLDGIDCARRKRACSVNERLRRGNCLGNISLHSMETKVKVLDSPDRGRGLYAGEDVASNVKVAKFAFTLTSDTKGIAENAHRFSAYRYKWTGRVFANLHVPDSLHLGNLANTALKGEVNNTRIVACRTTKSLTLVTTRAVKKGQEFLASYGASFNRGLRTETLQPLETYDEGTEIVVWEKKGFGYFGCPVCQKNFKSISSCNGHELNSKCFKDKL
jgi:hypothetical protein